MKFVISFLFLFLLTAQSANLVAYRTYWIYGGYAPPDSLIYNAAQSVIDLNQPRPGLTDLIFTYSPAWWNVTNCTRNTNFWLKDVRGMSSFSATRDGDTWYDVPATLVTRRHIYTRGHDMVDGWPNRVQKLGMPAYYFIGTNNAVHRAVITNMLVTRFNDPPPTYTSYDYSIGILSEDVPQNIEAVRFITNTYQHIHPNTYKYPSILFCQHRRASLPLTGPRCQAYFGKYPAPGCDHDYWVGGDSGSPVGFILDGEFLMSHGATTTGWSRHMQETVDILTLAAGLNTNDYQLKIRSLTNYPVIR